MNKDRRKKALDVKEMRIQQIQQILREKNYITVEELSQQLAVSPSTIRRDLAELSRRGLVVCGRNSVIPVSEMHTDTSISFRSGLNAQAKASIARRASHLVQNNSLVYLDSSSTVLNMADYLRARKNVVVVTNSLLVMERLRGSGIPLYLIGGFLSERSHAFYGPLAEEALNEYNFDCAFLSPVAITDEGYAAETTEIAATIRKAVVRRTRSSVLLCDHSKIGQYRAYNIGHINTFQYIVTDDPVRIQNTTATVLRV